MIAGDRRPGGDGLRIDRALYVLLVVVVAIGGIVLSWDIGSLDNNDFRRAIKAFLDGPADGSVYHPFVAPVLEWHIRDDPGSSLAARNTASIYFWWVMKLQTLFRPTFSVPLMAALSKTLVVVGCAFVADRYSKRARFGPVARALLFVGLVTCFFMSHTVFLLASFYQEHLFVVAFPILMVGMLGASTRRNRIVVAVALTLCGAAKTQYFYLPLLFAATVWLADRLRRVRFDRTLLLSIGIAQVICLVPLVKNGDRQVNYYHSTWFGSYTLLTQDELTALGVPPGDRDCVGVDRWGNKLVGPRVDHIEPGYRTCFVKDRQSIRDVLKPYLEHPLLLPELWALVSPAHLTARPFHVDRDAPYVIPSTAAGFGRGALLLQLSGWRDLLVTHHPIVIGCVAIAVAALLLWTTGLVEIFVTVVFMALFVFSQIPATLLGEGIRDLSKHLSMAQMCVDLLVVMTIANLAILMRHALGRDRRGRAALVSAGP